MASIPLRPPSCSHQHPHTQLGRCSHLSAQGYLGPGGDIQELHGIFARLPIPWLPPHRCEAMQNPSTPSSQCCLLLGPRQVGSLLENPGDIGQRAGRAQPGRSCQAGDIPSPLTGISSPAQDLQLQSDQSCALPCSSSALHLRSAPGASAKGPPPAAGGTWEPRSAPCLQRRTAPQAMRAPAGTVLLDLGGRFGLTVTLTPAGRRAKWQQAAGMLQVWPCSPKPIPRPKEVGQRPIRRQKAEKWHWAARWALRCGWVHPHCRLPG